MYYLLRLLVLLRNLIGIINTTLLRTYFSLGKTIKDGKAALLTKLELKLDNKAVKRRESVINANTKLVEFEADIPTKLQDIVQRAEKQKDAVLTDLENKAKAVIDLQQKHEKANTQDKALLKKTAFKLDKKLN